MSATALKQQQIKGFADCLRAFLHRYKIHAVTRVLEEHLQQKMLHLDLSQLPSTFKLSLATFFSRELGQELPKGAESSIPVLNNFYLRLLRKTYKTPSRKTRVLWDLLQCKDLAAKVPKEMIQAAFEKHQKTLTAVGVTPCHILTEFRTRMRDFCEKVRYEFRNETTLPPRRAYFNTKRSEGGCLSHFKKQGLIQSSGFLSRDTSDRRIDPPVLHIFGEPGKGKSHLQEAIIRSLSRRYGYDSPNVYSRTVGSDHWDGYRGQLIASIDDAFSSQQEDADCFEIIQICSNLPYVLPMADLKEKGRMFSSDFLFLSSNYPQICGSTLNNKPALFRRIFPAYKLLERNGDNYRIQRFTYDSGEFGGRGMTPGIILELKFKHLVEYLVDQLVYLHSERKLSSDNVFVPIVKSTFGEPGLSITFKREPPSGLPRVKAVAIPEPLKVRMITKGQEETWVMKPVQKAMSQALRHFDCFRLTHEAQIPLELLESFDQHKYLLSGDYESATDNLNMDIMSVAIEELKKVLPKFYHKWLDWEGGAHEIEYPKETGLNTVLQTRGQLMGSLLSFPILCVANATTIGMAQRRSLEETQCLINGDDILFSGTQRCINSWKKISSAMGLIPSIGKNYQSPSWGTVNSQLVIRDKNNSYSVRATGLFGPTQKVANFKSCIATALSIEPHSKSSLVIRARSLLKQTPESIDIPTDFGGLGISFDKDPSLQDKEIYFFRLMAKGVCRVGELDDVQFHRVPKHLLKLYQSVLSSMKIVEVPDLELRGDEDNVPFAWGRFRSFQKWYKTVPYLRDRIRKSDLQKELPLRLVKTVTVRIPKVNEAFINSLRIRV